MGEIALLTGKGFVVLSTGSEVADKDTAEQIAENMAAANGVAVIYAPVMVVRPKRDMRVSLTSWGRQLLGEKVDHPPAQLPAATAAESLGPITDDEAAVIRELRKTLAQDTA